MIHPTQIRQLSSAQLRQFRCFDMDCESLRCEDCPLGLVPTKVTLNNGREFTYRCAPAYASFFYGASK